MRNDTILSDLKIMSHLEIFSDNRTSQNKYYESDSDDVSDVGVGTDLPVPV